MTRSSSLEALAKLDIQEKEKVIFKALSKRKNMTRSEISRATGFPINTVTGRCNRMIKMNFIDETGKRKCRVTGNNVYVLSV